jgi:16S rRNA processing protein RimM
VSSRRLVVARLRKPHGLRGEVALFPLTDQPDTALASGRQVWVVDLSGEVVDGPLEIARSRGYHREWLVTFRGRGSRTMVENLSGNFLAAEADSLAPPEGDEVYLDELVGFAVEDPAGTALGLVSGWYELPAGLTLEIQGPKREFLLPYKKDLIRRVDRAGRKLVVELPEGLAELGT